MRRAFRKPFSLNVPFDWVETVAGNYGIRRASAIVTQTHRQAELLQRHLGRRAAAVIPNFHPQPRPEESLEKAPGRLLVVWIGNFKLVKRPEIFVRLAEELRELPDVRFAMAGRAGNERTHGELHDKIRALGNLEYLGELSHDQVNELLGRGAFPRQHERLGGVLEHVRSGMDARYGCAQPQRRRGRRPGLRRSRPSGGELRQAARATRAAGSR